MGAGKVSLFFIFVGLFGCAKPPQIPGRPPIPLDLPKRLYQDLRYPIYLITDPSFFLGCEKETSGEELCQRERVREVQDGVNDWFKHFYGPFMPRVFVAASTLGVPEDAKNRPIHLRVKEGFCDDKKNKEEKKKRWACYVPASHADPSIVFDRPIRITSRIAAHEFGHALGCGHNEEPEGGRSVMRSFPDSDVMPVDLEILCQIHKECPAHEERW